MGFGALTHKPKGAPSFEAGKHAAAVNLYYMKLRRRILLALAVLISGLAAVAILYFTHVIKEQDIGRHGLAAAFLATLVAVIVPLFQTGVQAISDQSKENIAVCDQLREHLTNWHDAFREAVNTDRTEDILSLKRRLEDVSCFKGGVRFQGRLGDMRRRLRQIPGGDSADLAIDRFVEAVLDAKEGVLLSLGHILREQRGFTLDEGQREYEQKKQNLSARVTSAYWPAIHALDNLSASIR